MVEELPMAPANTLDSTSTRLLRRLAVEDALAWQQLLQLYGPVVRLWLMRGGVAATDAEDVFQNVFLAVAEKIGSFQRQQGEAKFRAWLKTVTQHKIADHFRGLRAQPAQAAGGTTAFARVRDMAAPIDSREAADVAAGSDESPRFDKRLWQAVKREFREPTWRAFWRTAVDGQNATQVAEELGTTPAAVRKARSRVLRRLREALAESSQPADSKGEAGE